MVTSLARLEEGSGPAKGWVPLVGKGESLSLVWLGAMEKKLASLKVTWHLQDVSFREGRWWLLKHFLEFSPLYLGKFSPQN